MSQLRAAVCLNIHAMPATASHRLTSLIAAVLLAGASSSHAQLTPATPAAAPAQAAPATPVKVSYGQWQASFDAFARADLEKAPAKQGTLFVGSSTIRMWTTLAQDFRQLPVVINRGFGGSTMADCNRFARDLVVRYQPSQVLVYAGDNDLAEGRTPAQVLESFREFVGTVRAELPGVRIDYISIKPSPSRVGLLEKARETNALIGAYVQSLPNAGYIDIFTPMMTAEGTPRPELFLGDRLHLNETGYQLWQSIIAARLTGVPVAPGAPAPAAVTAATAVPAVLTTSASTRPLPSAPAQAPAHAVTATAAR
jgi:lysophospholipase L1-like esterase